MDQLINPFLLYGAIAVGGLGVCVALPRRRVSPQIVGFLLAALAGGGVLAALGFAAGLEALPNVHFYVFAGVALASALRVVTHPRPVYAALYFVLTVLASAGLYLLLSAEFMAFALIIIYAGAILITYLFVIMLATQAPTEDRTETLAEYDVASREPVVATAAGFVLLAALTTMLFGGVRALPEPRPADQREALLAELPRKVARALRETTVPTEDGAERSFDVGSLLLSARRPEGEPLLGEGDELVFKADEPWKLELDHEARTVLVERASGEIEAVPLPADLKLDNVESLAFNFLNEHPLTIEIAGIILLMAMLGATVLSRRQVELDEELKAEQAQSLRLGGDDGADAREGDA